MPERQEPIEPQSPGTKKSEATPPETPPRALTRRDFLVRSNMGAVAVGVMSGAGFAATLVSEPGPVPPQTAPLDPMTSRRVTLRIDGREHDVTVDVRESLWETMNYQLGLSNCNLGCDRAQCGACTILMDGRPVNGCTVLSARSGRGQEILTVAGISQGPGLGGLHPIQRAFWYEGGFQCGICTRGFVMATYALLENNPNPTTGEIKEALSGNICRCGEYTKILAAVRKAAAEMRGEEITYAAPFTTAAEAEITEAAGAQTSRQFAFVTALSTIEELDDIAVELRQRPGIVNVSGTERTITPIWDPTRLDETRVRQILEELGHPVAP